MTDDFPAFAPDFGRTEVQTKKEKTLPAPTLPPGSAFQQYRKLPLPWAPECSTRGEDFGSIDLRAWRVARGWSQFEVAKQTGLSLSTWIRWETKGVPELKRAKLREILNV